ncbi:RICIN domain-containing protein [Nocardiopsis exhalans]|uniref:RICIN domain-containing protein n=1 Tax=Nocardiopsis exhalans TaxID=163604 RepID=A0ABY5D5Y2_9ACTN|nr:MULTISPECIES: RICIN domain-containing protein [Nocardiopsis]USY18790.1 RICIN domain-containing protein [Nocardiopsis exhalans]
MPTTSRRSRKRRRVSPLRASLAGAAALALAGGSLFALQRADDSANTTETVSVQASGIDSDAYYVLRNANSGKVMDVEGKSADNGTEIIQWDQGDGAHQQFQFVPQTNSHFTLVARHSDKAVDLWERSTENGAEIRQYTRHDGANQQWRPVDAGDGTVSLINRHSGKALEVWEHNQDNGARLSQYDDHGGANQRWELIEVGADAPSPDPGGPTGWAAENGGTTGGAGGDTVTVTDGAQLTEALSASGPLVIQVQGTVSISGMHRVSSDKTLIGLGTDATITGGGLNISDAHNIVVRNINFTNADDDSINLQNGSTNIWIDHNTFSNGADGLIDIKRESDFVTVSWNHFHSHDKTTIIGHSDGHTADIGHLRVTLHHNFYDGTNTRHPRVRFSEHTHVFNNYYRDNREYAVASTMGANVLVEGNYFENLSRATTVVGYADSGPGNLTARDNVLVGSAEPETRGNVSDPPYSYEADAPGSVPEIVSAGAGHGKL